MANNFCIIDIGTNAVKCKLFANNKHVFVKNQAIKSQGYDDLDAASVVEAVDNIVKIADQHHVDPKRIYIAATEGLRTSKNAEQIKEAITKKTGRKVHILSPKREAWLSVLGGLSLIPQSDTKPPHYALYIESGGGSTEISVLDLQQKNIKLLDSISLPLGSKRYQIDNDDAKTQSLVTEQISALMQRLKDKKIDLTSSLGVVVNATTASRIMWQQHTPNAAYDPLAITQNRLGLNTADFSAQLQGILASLPHDQQSLIDKYQLKDEMLDGFGGYAHVLSHVFTALNNDLGDDFKKSEVITTVGGLKEGAFENVIKLDKQGQSPGQIEKTVFISGEIDDDDEDDEEEDNADLTTKISQLKLNKTDKVKLNIYKEYYQHHGYEAKFEEKTGQLRAQRAEQYVRYSSPDKLTIKNNPHAADNDMYERIVWLAKQSGSDSITFNETANLDIKLRIFAACQKHNMKITNFEFDKQMLTKVSPQTQNIVNNSLSLKQADTSTITVSQKTISSAPPQHTI